MLKNLIYTSLFKKTEYIDLICLLLKSVHLFSNIENTNTHILIYTTEEFAKQICDMTKDYKLPIFFDIFDKTTITCIFQLCCFRLQIFNNNFINQYDKILYIDSDVLITNDITKLFNLDIDNDKIYAIEESTINHFFYGSNFFNFDEIDKNTTAFSSGVMLFKNSPQNRELFETINNHIWSILQNNQSQILFYDQPFITYNCISRKNYDNKLLLKYAENNPSEIDDEKIIYHFPGTVGETINKYKRMDEFLNKRLNHAIVNKKMN